MKKFLCAFLVISFLWTNHTSLKVEASNDYNVDLKNYINMFISSGYTHVTLEQAYDRNDEINGIRYGATPYFLKKEFLMVYPQKMGLVLVEISVMATRNPLQQQNHK